MDSDDMLERDKIKKRIYITGILTLISVGYFLFGIEPTNLNLAIIYGASFIGLIVFSSLLAYYIIKFDRSKASEN